MIEQAGLLRVERNEGEVIDAVIERAHLARGEGMGKIDGGGAVDADRAKVARELVDDEDDAVSVELGVLAGRKDKGAFALAISDEHTRPFDLAPAFLVVAGALRKRIQDSRRP